MKPSSLDHGYDFLFHPRPHPMILEQSQVGVAIVVVSLVAAYTKLTSSLLTASYAHLQAFTQALTSMQSGVSCFSALTTVCLLPSHTLPASAAALRAQLALAACWLQLLPAPWPCGGLPPGGLHVASLPRSDSWHASVVQHHVAAAAQQQEVHAMCIPHPDAHHVKSTSRLLLLLLLLLPAFLARSPHKTLPSSSILPTPSTTAATSTMTSAPHYPQAPCWLTTPPAPRH